MNSNSLLVIVALIFLLSVFNSCQEDEEVSEILNSGDVAWTMEGEEIFTSQPAIVDDLLLVERDVSKLQAIDGASGEIVWTFQGEELDLIPGGGAFRAPLVKDKVVFWSTAWGNVYAIDLDTGEQIWKFKGYTRLEDGIFPNESFKATPVYQGGILYVLGLNRKLIALNGSTGQVIWENDQFGITLSFLLLKKGKILISDKFPRNNYRLIALDAITGTQSWSYDFSNRLQAYLFDDEQYVYIKDGSVIKGLDPETGLILYEFNSQLDGKLILVTSTHFFIESDGIVYAIDKMSKKQVWAYSISRGSFFKPYISGDYLFLTDTEYLHVIDVNTGETIWENQLFEYTTEEGGPVPAISYIFSPMIGNEYVFALNIYKLFALKL